MIPAIDVARYLIRLAAPADVEDADCLSNMRLQKLLYYVQGWHLAVYGRPLFEARIEAWEHGPVVREVYTEFKKYGASTIEGSEGSDSEKMSEKDKLFITGIWGHYKQYSASALRAKTHRERPWREAWETGNRRDTEIPQASLRDFFTPQANRALLRSDARLDPEEIRRTQEDIKAGRVLTVRELRRDLHRRHTGHDAGEDTIMEPSA